MLDFTVYLLYRAGSAIANALPLRLLFILGEFLGFCAWLFLPGYRRLANRNVSIAFGNEKKPREVRRLFRRHFQRMGANLVCSVKFGWLLQEKILQRVETRNLQA